MILSDGFPIYVLSLFWCSLVGRRRRFEFCERSEHVGNSNIPEYLLSDTNIIQPDRDEPRGIKSPREARGGFVVEADPAEIKHQFCVLDNLPRLLRGHRSRIQPGKLRVAFVDDALFHRRGSERAAQCLDRLLSFLL